MTKWLASVQSLQEAQVLLPALPDILDVKNPSQGALGALSVNAVAEIVTHIAGRCKISATIGDLPMQAEVINSALLEMASTGVDYVKVGLFPAPDLLACLEEMKATLQGLPVPVIAVLFADKMPTQNLVPMLGKIGFEGVMIDTAIKDGRQLVDHWDEQQLATFVQSVQQQGLICGLAGALQQQTIMALQQFGADYLGFRSALCEQQQRTAALCSIKAKAVQQTVRVCQPLKKAI